MKVTIHDTIKRPWGSETMVMVDDDGTIYDFVIPSDPKASTEDIEKLAIAHTEAIKNRKDKVVVESVESIVGTIREKLAILSTKETVKAKSIADIETILKEIE